MESALYPIQNKYRFNTLMNGTWQFETDPNSVGLDEDGIKSCLILKKCLYQVRLQN